MTVSKYLSIRSYNATVQHLTDILRAGRRTIHNPHPVDDGDGLQMHLLAALRLAGVDMGELTLNTPRMEGTKRQSLVVALASLAPDPVTGHFEPDQIKLTLGEAGNVWPETIREAMEDAA